MTQARCDTCETPLRAGGRDVTRGEDGLRLCGFCRQERDDRELVQALLDDLDRRIQTADDPARVRRLKQMRLRVRARRPSALAHAIRRHLQNEP